MNAWSRVSMVTSFAGTYFSSCCQAPAHAKEANCAVLTASGRELPPLVRILAAHPLIHTAEGEFFRNAICSACEVLRLSVLRVREREIESVANTSLGRSAAAVMKQIANAGKSLGSPWTQDQKKAALAAWMALHEHKGGTLISRRRRR